MRLFFFIYVLQTLCQQLKSPVEFVNKKFNAKIDTNPYFFHHVLRQQQQQKCQSDDLSCYLVNNKRYHIDPATRKFKPQVMLSTLPIIQNIEKQSKSKDKQYTQYYTDKSRYIIDEYLFYKNSSSLKMSLIDMEQYPLSRTIQKVDKALIINKQGDQIQLIQNQQVLLVQQFKINFNNFYLPSKEMMPRDISSELKQNQQKLEELESSLDLLSMKPTKNYIFTENKEGRILFESPVKLLSLYVKRRSQNYVWNKSEKLEMEGYYENRLRYILSVQIVDSGWYYVKGRSDSWISELKISKGTSVDNLLLQM